MDDFTKESSSQEGNSNDIINLSQFDKTLKDIIQEKDGSNAQKLINQFEVTMLQNETINSRLYNLTEYQKLLKNRIVTVEEKNRQLIEKNELLIKKIEEMKIEHKKEIDNLINEQGQYINTNETRFLQLEKEISQIKENSILYNDITKINKPSTSKEKEKNEEVYINFKYHHNNEFELNRIMEENSDFCDIHDTDDEYTYKIYDIDWIIRNFINVVEACSEIFLNNIEEINTSTLTITKNTVLRSNKKFRLNIEDGKSIIIRNNSELELSNFIITYHDIRHDSIFIIEEESKLKLEEGNIENNYGYMSIFNIQANSVFEMKYVKFKENIIKIKDYPTCIMAHENSSMEIANCEFLDHSNEEFPYSCNLIQTHGNLNIRTSYFNNNYNLEIEFINIITAIGSERINISDLISSKNGGITFKNVFNVDIKSSAFTENTGLKGVGTSLYFQQCKEVNIENSTFMNNWSNYGGATVYTDDSFIIVKDCAFEENSTSENSYGGALWSTNSNGRITKCTFRKNRSGAGGAIYLVSSNFSFEICIFEYNIAVAFGGAILANKSLLKNLNSNVFYGNQANDSPDIKVIID